MNILENDYLDDKLTADKIKEFRQQLDAGGKEAAAERMEKLWAEGNVDISNVPQDRLDDIWGKIKGQISVGNRSVKHVFWRWAQIAAVIMLPLLLATSFYFYHQNSAYDTEMIAMSTGAGERASIMLPDGTHVDLNENTVLKYNAKTFNKFKRQITFDGEGYFSVAKDADHPFTIDADELNVRVLGTKFNLSARKDSKTDNLTLAEGSVLFTAVNTGKSVTLAPNQKAVLDKFTGLISVETMNVSIQEATAWKRKEMVFRNTPMSNVIASLEKTYGVDITVSSKVNLKDLFTGIMSSANINEDLEIIEHVYNIKARIDGNKVVIE